MSNADARPSTHGVLVQICSLGAKSPSLRCQQCQYYLAFVSFPQFTKEAYLTVRGRESNASKQGQPYAETVRSYHAT